VTAGITPHLTVQASAAASFAPRFQFDFLPAVGSVPLGQVSAPVLDYALSVHQVLTYGTGVGVSYQPTKRTSFALNYDFRDVNTDTQYFAGRTQDAFGAFHLSLTKGLGVRVGYRYQLTHYTDAAGVRMPVRGDNIDIGVDYGLSRGLQLSRRTTLTFGFGTGAFNNGRDSRFRLVGNANLAQHISRRWELGAAYSRGMNFVDGFAAPIFSDSVNLRLNGELSRRWRVQGSVGYSFGSIDDFTASSRYQSYRGVLGINGQITRQLNAFVQYVNYSYDFAESAFLIQGAPAHLNRQGIRVGVKFAVPLLPGRRPRQRPPS
jgi:hypothetical protein